MKFQSRKPNYMTGFDEPPTYFETKEQLLKDPQLVRFATSHRFVRFAVGEALSSCGPWKCTIMADMIDGTFWCTGYCDSELPEDWFPKWANPDKREHQPDPEIVAYRQMLKEKEDRRAAARIMSAKELEMVLDQIGCPKEILEVISWRLHRLETLEDYARNNS